MGEAALDIKAHIRFLEKRVELLKSRVVKLLEKDGQMKERYDCLISVKGIARLSAIQILGELAVLPADMSKRQWSAHAALAPSPFDSGSSVKKPARVGRSGNLYLKRALYMPALVAVRHEPSVRAFYRHLVSRGKKPIQAIVAVMRKLLCAIWGMFNTGSTFNGGKFFKEAAFVS